MRISVPAPCAGSAVTALWSPRTLLTLWLMLGCGVSHTALAARHALIVGVERLALLPSIPPLPGVLRDVQEMTHFARAHWGVTADRLHVLANTPAAKAPPTHAAVVGAMQRLVREAQSGDEVLVYLSGHGFKQPAPNDSEETDGYDEVFALADTSRWDPAIQSVRNALIDNALREWLSTLTENKVNVWLIVDSCYAGGMSRGNAQELEQIGTWRITAEKFIFPEWLGIKSTRAQAKARLPEGRDGKSFRSIPGLAPRHATFQPHHPRVLAFYAADETTKAIEVEVDRKEVGLFTHLFMRTARQNAALDQLHRKGGLPGRTYKDLTEDLALSYTSLPAQAPRPVFSRVPWAQPAFLSPNQTQITTK